ncbi:MAG: hypothetical protein JWR04_963 [Rhodoglobus sp.]|nr:hypothetical protein [Rhodoglobus sp.]
MSGPTFAVSPAALSLSALSTSDQIADLVARLVSLKDLSGSIGAKVLVQNETFAVLASTGRLPVASELRKVLASRGEGLFSAADVETQMYALMDRAVDLDLFFGIADLLVDQLTPAPNCERPEHEPELNAVQVRFWNAVATVAQHRADEDPLIIEDLAVPARFRCELHEAELSDSGEFFCPCVFDTNFETYISPRQAILLRRAEAALLTMETLDSFLTEALSIADERFTSANSFAMRRYQTDWTIGSNFADSIRLEGVLSEGNLMERAIGSAIEVINRTNLARSHALRVSSGGASAQRRQGGFGAQRHDIDHEWHVHYWVGPSQKVQLASIVRHNDFRIPDFEP